MRGFNFRLLLLVSSLTLSLYSTKSWSQLSGNARTGNSSIGSPGSVSAMWMEGEHMELADDGMTAACIEKNISGSCPRKGLSRGDGQTFSYGDVVMLADYYNTPEEFIKSTNGNLDSIIKCAREQQHSHQQQETGKDPGYKSCNMKGFLAKPDYLEVVAKNYDHFSWNNVTAYVRNHEKAIQFALQAYAEKNPTKKNQLLSTALIYNGFADHYLTDAFASGHIRTPRLAIKRWATQDLSGFWKGLRGDILANALHNVESMDFKTGAEIGVLVEDLRGHVWKTNGDGGLHLRSQRDSLVQAMPRFAVQKSVGEVLDAALNANSPEAEFFVIELVPFIKGDSLAQKLTPEFQKISYSEIVATVYGAINKFLRLLTSRRDVDKMIQDLPHIYTIFHDQIKSDYAESALYQKRIPQEYYERMLTVD